MDACLFEIFKIDIDGRGGFFFAGKVFGIISCNGFVIGAAMNR